MDGRMLTIALTGNPNAGKTTVFNALTGERQHVGNYPGVTVEKKEGVARLGERELAVVDLPGTYSLTAYSVEEIVARNFLIEQRPDVVVDIVDCSNLDRNLYLATQLLELGVPLVLAFNMFDVAVARSYQIDDRKLSALLGVPIVHTVGHKGRGLERLLARAVRTAEEGPDAVARQKAPSYGSEIEPHVEALTALVAKHLPAGTHHRWFAVKLLENDEQTVRRLRHLCPDGVKELLDHAGRMRKHIEGICGDSAEIILADRRYGFISGACAEAVRRTVQSRRERSDRIDRVLLNRWIGLPVFALLMFLMFQLTFWAGTPAVDWLDHGKSLLADAVRAVDGDGHGLLASLLADGIIEGVGAVLSFVPLIVLLFLGIAVLEDSGYMARAAFLLDRQMHRIGLHGKSFIPMLIGFGCTVPAILATRTLETRRDRLTTILILPLMSCGARLPVYVLLIGAFFGDRVLFRLAGVPVGLQGTLLFAVYLVGVALAIATAKLLRRTVLRGEVAPLVLELPSYRMPTLKGLVVHMIEPTWHYVKKAGTIILAIVVIMWALRAWPALPEAQRSAFDEQRRAVESSSTAGEARAAALEQIVLDEHRTELEHSALGRIGKAVAPAFAPCGFDWKISTALLGSLAAKEAFIGQMGVIYAAAESEGQAAEVLRARLREDYTPLTGLCVMLFVLIGSPCIATVAVTVREAGGWKWAAFQWGYLTALAWLVATAVYQVGRFLT